jgi:acetate kinase
MRDVNQAVKDGNDHAKLALDMYHYRIKKYIGAYMAALGGADAIVFTGGVGENGDNSRLQSCTGLEFLGIKIDPAVNATVHGEEKIISTPDSAVKVIVVPTDEEFMIASDTMEIAGK